MRIPFYYDYACPWAYLGSCRVEPYFQELGVEIDFRPVRLAQLAEPSSGKPPEPGERKKRNYVADLKHWAEMIGAEFYPDVRKRKRPETRLLLQAALVAKKQDRLREFHYPAFRARWAEGLDVSSPEVVRDLLEGAGLDADAALERARSDELAQHLERETRDAIARGVFGVPTIFVGDEMFWGNDRFELVRYYIQKQSPF
ncbi:MAG: 2-hydroxychromene-2-carboxylate isomerase [Myxococcota bacterium]